MTFNESKASKLTSQSKYFITDLYSWVISSLANVKTCFNFLKKIYFLVKKKYLLQLLFLSSRNFFTMLSDHNYVQVKRVKSNHVLLCVSHFSKVMMS